MPAPYNYFQGPQTAIDPRNFLVGMEAGQGLLDARNAAQAQQSARQSALIAAQQAAARDAEFAAVANAPGGASTEDLQRLMIKYPDRAEALKKTFDTLAPAEQEARKGQMLRISSAIRAGNHNVAIDDARQLAKAYENAGRTKDATAMENVARTIEEDPEGAGRNLDLQLAAVLGDKFAETMTTIDTRQADVAKAEAEAAIKGTEARFAADKALADIGLTKAQTNGVYAKIKNDADRLGLDRERLNADVTKGLSEIGKMPPGVVKDVNDSIRAASGAGQSAATATALAGKFREYGKTLGSSTALGGAGAPAKMMEFIKGTLGLENDLSSIRKQFRALRNSDVIKNLPAGAASDSDIELIMSGWEEDTGNPEKIAESLEALARVQSAVQRAKRIEGEFLARNTYLGPAQTDMVIQGVPVKAGETFEQVVEKITDASDKALAASF